MNTPSANRFEQSFVYRMIRDFFLLLVAVAAVELGIRYLALLYQFRTAEPQRVNRAAEQLASDVKSIMLNSGGPLAAQTVYPILNRNYDDLGLSIAVEPSQATVESMRITFKMEALGLKARWPEGAHQQAAAVLKAEQFCLNCHVKAQVGDVLGTVTVRSYLARKEESWWQEVRVTAGALTVKILVHTFLLLLLLKVRMEPMLALRGTVAALAKGVMDLRPRARVASDDEFGDLATDLNHFLDRVALIVHDLDRILSQVVSVGERLGSVNRRLEGQLDGLRSASVTALADAAQRGVQARVAAAHEAGAFAVLLRALEDKLAAQQLPAGAAERIREPIESLREPIERLRQRFDEVGRALEQALPPVPAARAQAAEYEAFAQSLREMAVLESTMQAVAESGQLLLQRLVRERDSV